MAKLILKQLAILLWKSMIQRRRHWLSTFFELLIPLVLSLAIACVYASGQNFGKASHSPFNQTSGDFKNSSGNWIPPQIFKEPTIDMNFNKTNEKFFAIIYYGPTSNLTDDIMQRVRQFSPHIETYGLATEDLVNIKMELLVANETVDYNIIENSYGIIFDENSIKNNRLVYTIRVIGYQLSRYVDLLFPEKYYSGPAFDIWSYNHKFCWIQILINKAFLAKQTISSPKQIETIKAFKYPFPGYKNTGDDGNMFSLRDSIAATIAIGYVIMCPLIVKRITDEKVAKAKEMLRMIGMSDWVFWSSHFISFFLIMLFHSILFTIFFCIGFGGDPLITYSSGFLFFVILVLYSVQSLLFCMTITTVFNRPVPAVIVTVILWIVTYAVPIGVLNPMFHKNMDVVGTNGGRIFSSILPNMGLSWCLAIIGQFEVLSTGAKWSTLYHRTSLYSNLTLGLVMGVMFLSCFLYAFLIWYLDNVWPFQYGVPKPVYFPFLKSYWWPTKYRNFEDKNDFKPDLVIDSRNFEREPETKVTVMVKNLRKEFGGFGTPRKTAVDNISINIYDRQITVLLGHNGAGKTTTMNMITGIYPPTSGSVSVDGYNIQTETNKARRSIGLCPQVCYINIYSKLQFIYQ